MEDVSSRAPQALDRRRAARRRAPLSPLARPCGWGPKGGRRLCGLNPSERRQWVGRADVPCPAMGAPSPASYSACFLSGFLLAAALPSSGTDACPSIAWIPFQKSCYALLLGSSEVFSMEDARELCQDNASGADIITINSKDENNFIQSSFRSNWHGPEYISLGMFFDIDDDIFKWYDDSKVNFTNWIEEESSNELLNTCATMHTASGGWKKVSCEHLPLTRILCEATGLYEKTHLFACPSIAWIPFQKSCYGLLMGSSEVYSMEDARELCQDFGADIITINSKDENNFIQSNFRLNWHGPEYISLGMFFDIDDDIFKWYDDSKVNFTNWIEEESSNELLNTCATMHTASGGWKKVSCEHLPLTRILCETTVLYEKTHLFETAWTSIIVIISTITVAISAAFLWFLYQRSIYSRPSCSIHNSTTQIPCDNETFFIDEYSA
ncbi:CD302 antigen isoform X2 [Erythrolamprus reginae]|uniref:CD302 antigen isoform X2 n=1 Tax=Erythrolamprus reginae TaxID=121349 RepID=UPI00396CA9F2